MGVKGMGIHPDSAGFVREVMVEPEAVGLADGLAGRLLEQDLVLGAAQRVARAHQLLIHQVEALLELVV